jgi:hypothetical protein
MKRILHTLLLGAVCVFSSAAQAGETKLPKEKPIISITFPDKWKVEVDDEDGDWLDAHSADEELYFYVETSDAESLEQAVKDSLEYLGKEGVKGDQKTLKQKDIELNGMKGVITEFEGTDADGACVITLLLLAVNDKQGVQVLSWGSREAEKKHEKAIETIVKSLKPTKPAKGKEAEAETKAKKKEK